MLSIFICTEGSSNWDAPKSLYEMFQDVDLNTAQFINDYRINLIAPNEIKDFSMFKTELGKVLEFLNASDDLEKMKKIIEKNHETYLHMYVDSARMIETFSKTKLETEKYEEEEEINVCKAIDDMIQEAVDEKDTQMCKAISDMIKEAVEEKETQMHKTAKDKYFEGEQNGAQKKIIELICKKVKKDKPVTVIADELEENVNDIQDIYDKVVKYAPEYNLDLICREMENYS